MAKENKKGQEEIMGFVLIVVLVIIIGLVFLFFLRPSAEIRKTVEVSNLLYAMLGYTAQERSIAESIKLCSQGIEESCSLLESELSSLLDATTGYVAGLRGYSLNISNDRQLFYKEAGNKTATIAGDATFVRATGQDIAIILRFYY